MLWPAIAIGVALLAAAAFVGLRQARRRAAANLPDETIQRELVAFLGETMPALKIVEEKPRELKLANSDGAEATMFLDNMIDAIRSTDGSVAERRRVYDEFTRPLDVYAGTRVEAPLSEQTASIFPRLARREYLEQMSAGEPVHRRIGETPLHIAYVLDQEKSVRFIVKRDLEELKMTIEQLDELAMRNFRPMMPEESLRAIMEKPGAASVISSGDSFDATRLILLPEYLKPGEVLAVAVPDRDTMVIVPKPDEKAWEVMAQIAAKPMSSRVILTRPLRVTGMGIEVR